MVKIIQKNISGKLQMVCCWVNGIDLPSHGQSNYDDYLPDETVGAKKSVIRQKRDEIY
jgi:hypothetical protein